MSRMTQPFLNLSRHGRRLDVVTAGHGLEFIAVSVVAGTGDPIGDDEAVMLRERGFRRITDDAYVNLRSMSSEASLISLYRGARRVDYNSAKHSRETFPGSAATSAEVMHVAWGLVDEDMAARAHRLHAELAALREKGKFDACAELAQVHLDRLRDMLSGVEALHARLSDPEPAPVGMGA